METLNKFLVGAHDRDICIGAPWATQRMTPDDALLLAAYLVAMAEPFAAETFADVRRAVASA